MRPARPCSRRKRRDRARHKAGGGDGAARDHRAGAPPRSARGRPPARRQTNRSSRRCDAPAGAIRRPRCAAVSCSSRSDNLRQSTDRAGTVGRLPKAVDRHEQLARIAPLLGQLAGAGIGLGRLGRTEPFGREQRQAPGQLQLDLPSVPSRPFGQCRQCCEPALEMADRFEMGRARRGMLAGLQPLIDRALGIAGAGQMMGQEFGLALDEIGEMLLQHRRDPGMQFLPPCAQQRAVGGVLHQRVLEEVGGVRSDAAAEQQPGIAELIQRGSQLASQHAAPPARSVHRRTRGRAPRRSAQPPWRPARADRGAPSARHARSPGPTARQASSSPSPRRPGRRGRRFRAPPWSAPRRTAARRRRARRSRRRSRAARPALPASRSTSAAPSRSPSRFSANIVTCGWPLQACWNSGRKVTTSSTGSRRTRSTVRSSNSREVGSIQCASSNTISTGRSPRLGFELVEQRLEQLLAFALRAEIEVRGGTRQ